MSTDIVQKLWGFCHTLRHDGIDYGDYIEQITYLLFLKMANEKSIDLSAIEVLGKKGKIEFVDCSWPTLEEQSGTELTNHYIEILRALGQAKGILGDIYSGAQSRFNNPVNLKKLVSVIDETEWTSLGVDVKAQAYEGLLEKAASEGKKGAGQFFTPRILRRAAEKKIEKPESHGIDPIRWEGGKFAEQVKKDDLVVQVWKQRGQHVSPHGRVLSVKRINTRRGKTIAYVCVEYPQSYLDDPIAQRVMTCGQLRHKCSTTLGLTLPAGAIERPVRKMAAWQALRRLCSPESIR